MPAPTIKQFVYRAGTRKRVPVSGTFELTPRCNLNCKMCYIHMSAEEQQAAGAELTTEQWLDIGRQAVKAGMIYLLVTGGEPMLRPDFTTIYSEIVKMGVIISVNTNATLITPEIIDCFRKHPPELVNVTLYGAEPHTYADLCGVRQGFERARDGVRMLVEAGIRVSINTTFTTANQQDMEALVAYAKEMGIPIRTASFTFPPVRNGHPACEVCLSPEEQGRLNARFEYLSTLPEYRAGKAERLRQCLQRDAARDPHAELPEEGRPSSCMAGRGLFWMAWNGEMYPCGMMSRFAAAPGSFDEQWKQVRDMTDPIRLPALCKECAFRTVCPSCAAVTESVNGDPSALVESLCRYTKTYCHTFVDLVSLDAAPPQVEGKPQEPDEGDLSPFVCL